MSVRVMTMVWDAPFPAPIAKLIALKLADCANDDGANVFPSRRTIERDTGCGETTVKRWLRTFDASGLTTVDERGAGGAYRNTTVRRFNMQVLRGLIDGGCQWLAVADDWTVVKFDASGGPHAPRPPVAPVADSPDRGARRGARAAPKPLNRQEPSARRRDGQRAAVAPLASDIVRIASEDPRFAAVIDILARTSPSFAEASRLQGFADVRPDTVRRVMS